jgi:hypothetical protein
LAVTDDAPAGSEDVVIEATPPLSVPVPSEVAPAKNSTVPVGTPVAGLTGVTVAVSVTGCPRTGSAGDDLRSTDELACETVKVVADEVLGVNVESPRYCTVKELELPNGIAVVGRIALPELSVAVPSEVAPTKN